MLCEVNRVSTQELLSLYNPIVYILYWKSRKLRMVYFRGPFAREIPVEKNG